MAAKINPIKLEYAPSGFRWLLDLRSFMSLSLGLFCGDLGKACGATKLNSPPHTDSPEEMRLGCPIRIKIECIRIQSTELSVQAVHMGFAITR
jgi:hypothetical protein